MEIAFSQRQIVEGIAVKYDPERETLVQCSTLRLVGHTQLQEQSKCNLILKGAPTDVTGTKKIRHLRIV